MTDASVGPTVAEVFRKWQVFFESDPASATSLVDSAAPDIAVPLQRLIDDYFSSRSTAADRPDGAPPEEESPPDIPGYTILERLGRGGMGEVFRVRDALDREHALKMARRGQLSTTGRERFRAEAHAMTKLDHPNVVRVGHFGDVGGRPYFEMHLYPANLSDRVADYTDPRAAVRLVAQVADGVGHLHARGFIHRDLKPSNILLTAEGRPVVSDFGLIKGPTDSEVHAADSGAHGSAETNETGAGRSRTVAGMILGTRRYMAPDQAAGLNHLAGPSWDVWALGVMLHELLTGQPPRSSAAPDRLLNPIEPDNPPPTRIQPDLDPRLSRIIEKCLARDPADRYPNGSAVAADLKGWLNRRRRMWTRVAATSFLALVVVVTITAAMNRPLRPADPPAPTDERERILADIQKQLRDGKTVELIGEAGMPRWYELVISGGSQPFVSDFDGTMRASEDQISLIDLPPTGLERYRFVVQIQQWSNNPAAEYGIYAGRHRLPLTTAADADCFVALWFNKNSKYRDHPVGPPRMWEVGALSLPQTTAKPYHAGSYQFEQGPNLAQIGAPKDGWHTLAVEVRRDQMTWSFDGEAAQPVSLPLPSTIENRFVSNAKFLADTRPKFSPAGGYGLFVQHGTAAFRNALVSPLDK
jgi:serine/threonine-protein kinase